MYDIIIIKNTIATERIMRQMCINTIKFTLVRLANWLASYNTFHNLLG